MDDQFRYEIIMGIGMFSRIVDLFLIDICIVLLISAYLASFGLVWGCG